ncbi:hypothetical protein LEP1GSC005_0818 [Leptospira santarosai str. ST188]|nr:hypothetical protein LEP1GSC005_0818 [Leptospira santarosai str. ST188]EMO72173.1 hypothetical protein LEP1GSC130_3890 [Leptospira santarosai str. 200403458]EMO99246.1 hypothetical protein LEP1GSC120_2957 [Leptospira santarosai str. 200702252]
MQKLLQIASNRECAVFFSEGNSTFQFFEQIYSIIFIRPSSTKPIPIILRYF